MRIFYFTFFTTFIIMIDSAVMLFGIQSLSAQTMDPSHHEQSSLKQIVSSAITKFEQTAHEHWSYQVSRYENEEGEINSSFESFQPNVDVSKRWSLLKINGKTPSQQQIKNFVRTKVKQANPEKENTTIKLREIIELDSLQLYADNQVNMQLSFTVHLEQLGEQATKNLRGILTYHKQHQFIKQIEIVNTGRFSPMLTADITDFRLILSFYHLDGAVLIHQQKLNMKGSFAFFAKIDEMSLDTFSDYQYHGQPL